MVNHLGPEQKNLWAEAVAAANYIRNRMFSMGCQREGVTSIEAPTGIKPNVSNLREFGCKAFGNNPSQLWKGMFASQAQKGMMVGYLGTAYRVYIPATGRILVSKDVRMIEVLVGENSKEVNLETE